MHLVYYSFYSCSIKHSAKLTHSNYIDVISALVPLFSQHYLMGKKTGNSWFGGTTVSVLSGLSVE